MSEVDIILTKRLPCHTGSDHTPEMDGVMPDNGFPEWAGLDRSGD